MIEGQEMVAPVFIQMEKGSEVSLTAIDEAEVYVLGGEALPKKRHIWWNFVSSSREKIEDAKRRWKAQEFPLVPGETEFVPLPEKPPSVEKSTLP